MFSSLRHLACCILSEFGSRKDLVLENSSWRWRQRVSEIGLRRAVGGRLIKMSQRTALFRPSYQRPRRETTMVKWLLRELSVRSSGNGTTMRVICGRRKPSRRMAVLAGHESRRVDRSVAWVLYDVWPWMAVLVLNQVHAVQSWPLSR